jgi:hypothetical protein
MRLSDFTKARVSSSRTSAPQWQGFYSSFLITLTQSEKAIPAGGKSAKTFIEIHSICRTERQTRKKLLWNLDFVF